MRSVGTVNALNQRYDDEESPENQGEAVNGPVDGDVDAEWDGGGVAVVAEHAERMQRLEQRQGEDEGVESADCDGDGSWDDGGA